ncbi:hypothetical protein [Empedobacter falsenii]|uniref:hypothetical protein n=1 Tax=Empedobacter falsenii TaxID=343874 RepID=UPI003A801029
MGIIKPLKIIEGWVKAKIVCDQESKDLSQQRLSVCMECPKKLAYDSKMLSIINGKADESLKKFCKDCTCPILQKSLVKSEKCPHGFW